MAGPLLGGTVRNRQNAAESLVPPLSTAESKPKPSFSSLKNSLGETHYRILRFLAFAFAALTCLLYVAYLSTKKHKANVVQQLSKAHGLSLGDYPEVYVADSPPFKDLLGYVGVQMGSPKASLSAKTRVPSEAEVLIPRGIDASAEPKLRIIVLTMDRASSLRRLLGSLQAANYDGDRVDLDIWVDKASDKGSDNGAISDQAEEAQTLMMSTASEANWTYGVRTLHKRLENAGLYEQWIYTWNVTEETTEACVILEDDLEVSPSFYLWLKQARQLYAADSSVAAFTLQRAELRPRQVPGVASGKLRIDASVPVFKYRLLGTWGFSPEKRAWLEFRAWYEEMRNIGARPYVDNLMTTSWYKSQEKGASVAKTMWSQWFIKFADLNDYFTVYANLPDKKTLASNYREGGMHYSDKPRRADYPVFKGDVKTLVFPETPVYLDWDGRELKNRSTREASFRRAPTV